MSRKRRHFSDQQKADAVRRHLSGKVAVALAHDHCQRNVLEGGLFLFVNKRRDRIKLLWWDDDGLVIWYKRLEQATFEIPVLEGASHVTLTTTRLSLLLGGIELASGKHRKRYLRIK